MMKAPRHYFVPEEQRDKAYDAKMALGLPGYAGISSISSPEIVGFMTHQLSPDKNKRVLEVGTGTGWQAAVLSPLVREVFTIEKELPLADEAANRIRQLGPGYDNVHIYHGDGALGLAEHAPYDGILVTAAALEPPPALLTQLAPSGRMVIPLGGPAKAILTLIEKDSRGVRLRATSLMDVSFVPLR
jgi:protein-L-isoaspartate(D-aspartate) O-methyltransferase